jgi:hypothetical protein
VLWRRSGALTGGEDDMLIPAFVLETVLLDKAPPPDPVKISFFLSPAAGACLFCSAHRCGVQLVWLAGSSLPEIPGQSKARLNAPRLLRMHRVAAYLIERLDELPLASAPGSPGKSDKADSPVTPAADAVPADLQPEDIVLLCGDSVR